MITRAWRVYGLTGHRQRESFHDSQHYDFSNEQEGKRELDIANSDKTGTNDYTLIRITRDTAEECEDELHGQISDGVFENSNVGHVEEVTASNVKMSIEHNFGSVTIFFGEDDLSAYGGRILIDLDGWRDFSREENFEGMVEDIEDKLERRLTESEKEWLADKLYIILDVYQTTEKA